MKNFDLVPSDIAALLLDSKTTTVATRRDIPSTNEALSGSLAFIHTEMLGYWLLYLPYGHTQRRDRNSDGLYFRFKQFDDAVNAYQEFDPYVHADQETRELLLRCNKDRKMPSTVSRD